MSGSDASVAGPMRLRLDLSYDGTDFSGWAVQPGRRTVAGVLGEALATLFRRPVPLVVAGRTDAGVHATGQVAHIDVDPDGLAALAPRGLAGQTGNGADAGVIGLRRRLAGLLPPDVRVPVIGAAPDGFDARFSALRRHYRYRIVCSDWGVPPLGRADVLAWRRQLDVHAMQDAADPMLGLHDFAAYCKPRAGGTTVRDLQRLTIARVPPPAKDCALIEIDVTADAFCHSMVRSLVGALIAVGERRFEVDRPAQLLAARQRTEHISVAPARGLTLIGVDYPPDAMLADRAAATRALREDPCDCGGLER
ncbi:MAG: tRNA pseudouridine(38-40) synthase TruA [Actinobacteria bacterium 69-20]|nr:MAG: tRNA pseudouridine(38-40) synthase TruA [Actinobacteria bacterium 69-20]